jgi:hypothetical protein
MNSDIKSIRVSATGDTTLGRARIVALSVLHTAAGAGRLTLRNTSATGSILIDLDFDAAADTNYMELPHGGVLFTDLVWVSAATNVTAVTLFYIG